MRVNNVREKTIYLQGYMSGQNAAKADINKDKEIERLKAENAELRARLEKAVELPRIIHSNAYEWFVQYQNEYGLFFYEIFYSERAAEARLKEIKEKNND